MSEYLSGYLYFHGEKIKFDNYHPEEQDSDNVFKEMLLNGWLEENISECKLEVIHMGDSTVDVYLYISGEEINSKVLVEDKDFNFLSIVEDLFADYITENIDDFKLVLKVLK